GDAFTADDAVDRGLQLVNDGADIVDVGGESTRPGAEPVSIEEELRRTIPVIERLAEAGVCVSIDTRHALVMESALAAGAEIINDVTALTGDRRSMDVVANSNAPVILMHMLGGPGTMQANPIYENASREVFEYLSKRVQACEAAGIKRDRIALDPGIGFGKTVKHNLQIMNDLGMYERLGLPVLLGLSRKSFIGGVTGEGDPKKRLPGSLAAALACIERGAHMVRVHDVAETKQALDIWTAIDLA
ncbi:MAG: dihydropteroate synthase, partial [Magnetovibrio sp.]|nr:dihydropteroate synthase [Magnetovibrio sp.]